MASDPRDDRQATLRDLLGGEGLQALIVSHLPNIRYLTGFRGTAGVAVLLADRVVLVTDFRYEVQAEDEVRGAARVVIVGSDIWEQVWHLLRHTTEPDTVGFEADAVTVSTAERFTSAPVRLRPVRGLVERLRVRKSSSEVEALRAAAVLAGDAFAAVLPAIRPGARERAVAAALERELRVRGSEWHPFPTIVASGPRSALPHAGTADRVIETGDLVLLDFGAQVDGYCADLTRTVVVGRADQRQRTMYDLVRDAQRAVVTSIRPGMTGAEADGLARSRIAERGFGEAFGHSLGHGLGLEVHEAPRLSKTNQEPLPAGAVVTVEPGVYFPGWGGIRIEDDIHLSPGGAVFLSDGNTELLELT